MQERSTRLAVYQNGACLSFTNSFFGIIEWMPFVPSTTCVTRKSTPMLDSVNARSNSRPLRS